jgi:hypothetical protein
LPDSISGQVFIDEVLPSISDKVGDQKEVRNVSSYLPTNLGTHQTVGQQFHDAVEVGMRVLAILC